MIYSSTAITSKAGINFVRSITEAAGSLFHKIEHENDLGIDAIIEIIRAGRPLGIQLASQIKSGDSYYDVESETCTIPILTHREYWERYPLPVLGIVYVPSLGHAYWTNIKAELRDGPSASVIRFVASKANVLNDETFSALFVPTVTREPPLIDLPSALALVQSSKLDEALLGLSVLFRRYPDEVSTWDALLDYFVRMPPERIPNILIYHLAHIPGHGDIAYSGPGIGKATRHYARVRIEAFRMEEVRKLLSFIDREDGIARGTVGQSVEAIVSAVPASNEFLTSIATDDSIDIRLREHSALILAMHSAPNSLAVLASVESKGSWFATELIRFVKEFGGVNPYG